MLQKHDKELLDELFSLLTRRTAGSSSPYGENSTFGKDIASLPVGLRAMAATHWLDISLLDSITWHFGNFGESHLVEETEAGLKELGLNELAFCFAEAKKLMLTVLQDRTEAGGDSDEILERAGLSAFGEELNLRAYALTATDVKGRSVIYEIWLRYARTYPENVFESL